MKSKVKTINGKTLIENSYVDPSALTKEEYDVWRLKDNKDRLTKAQWGSVQRIHKKRTGN